MQVMTKYRLPVDLLAASLAAGVDELPADLFWGKLLALRWRDFS
jgi:hypothetical protein